VCQLKGGDIDAGCLTQCMIQCAFHCHLLLCVYVVSGLSACGTAQTKGSTSLGIRTIPPPLRLFNKLSLSKMNGDSVRAESFPAPGKRATGTVNGSPTEVEALSFSDKIMITVSQGGRVAQWVSLFT
jgi:hypothetical protein